MAASSELALVGWKMVLAVVSVSFGLGLFVSLIYRLATPSATFSIGVQHTLIYLALIVSLVMLIISNQLARAFTLVGALAVIRFRTPVKDARDASFIFLGLAAGMGAGVGMFLETALGVLLIGLFMVAIRVFRWGMHPKGETLVKFTLPTSGGEEDGYPRQAFSEYLRDFRLINTRSLEDGRRIELTYLVRPKRDANLTSFSRALAGFPGIQRATVIVCDDEGLVENVF